MPETSDSSMGNAGSADKESTRRASGQSRKAASEQITNDKRASGESDSEPVARPNDKSAEAATTEVAPAVAPTREVAAAEVATREVIQARTETVETTAATPIDSKGEVAKETAQSRKSSQSTAPDASQDSIATRSPETTAQASAVDNPVEPAAPAAASTGGWKMEPIKLPADMELVETRPGVPPEPKEATAMPKTQARRRTAPAKATPPSPESLVQIETRGEPETENADNR
jgi:hypothetical protein